MSERMNKERAIKILEKIKSKSEEYIKNSQARINTTDFTPLKNSFVRKQEYANKKIQALDIAIESLETRYQMNDKGEITPIDNEWVDVRNRLPKDNERVLVYLKEDQMVHIGKYEAPTKEDIEWIKSDMYDDGITDEDVKREFKRLELMGLGWEILEVDEVNFECEVIAWKPLPEPYERKE